MDVVVVGKVVVDSVVVVRERPVLSDVVAFDVVD